MAAPPIIAVTCGEPAGIGPELLAMLATRHATNPFPARLVFVGDRDVLAARARRIASSARYVDYGASGNADAGATEVWHHALPVPVEPGTPDAANAAATLAQLAAACDACATGAFDALVTAPAQKSVMQDAGLPFMGHTEFFAARTGTSRVVMMLCGGAADRPLRVALVTTHLALKDVAAAIDVDTVATTLGIVAADLGTKFGLAAPRIAVCGLNPHAGEGGHLGREEIDAIAPAIARIRATGVDVEGPFPADTVFVPDIARRYDAIVAMYHDQGLPVLKAASFGGGVNVTLGLPFIRTSVDHGTALDRARDPALAATVDPGSLIAALELGIGLARRAQRD